MIESESKTVTGLFSESFYAVPAFQREYVWKPINVTQMLDDICSYVTSKHFQKDDTYCLGSIVVVNGRPKHYDLVDGQQRLTTLFLTLAIALNRLHNANLESAGDRKLASKVDNLVCEVNERDEFIPRLTVNYLAGDTPRLVQALIKNGEDPYSAGDDDEDGDEEVTAVPQSASAKNIAAACKTIRRFLDTELEKSYGLDIKAFVRAVCDQAMVTQIAAKSLRDALIVFETMNNRGVGLDAMDLAKNLIFMNADDADHEEISRHWGGMRSNLERVRERASIFLRHFVLSDYADGEIVTDREDIFTWLRNNPSVTRIDAQALEFARRLASASRAYANIKSFRSPCGTEDTGSVRRLVGINPNGKSFLVPLLAARHLSKEVHASIAREIEDAWLVFHMGRAYPAEVEEIFVDWADWLKRMTPEQSVADFVAACVKPQKDRHALRFVDALRQLNCRSQAKKVRYILARMADRVQAEMGEHSIPAIWDKATVEIEHIYPRKPSEEAKAECGEISEALVECLGNLTLLGKSRNTALKNAPYSIKTASYSDSPIALTKLMAKNCDTGGNNAIDRGVRRLRGYGLVVEPVWNDDAIGRRMDAMVNLACDIWGVTPPTPW